MSALELAKKLVASSQAGWRTRRGFRMSSPLLVPGSDQIVADLRRRWDGADGRSGGERHGKELPTERPPVIVRKGVELLTWVDLREWMRAPDNRHL